MPYELGVVLRFLRGRLKNEEKNQREICDRGYYVPHKIYLVLYRKYLLT